MKVSNKFNKSLEYLSLKNLFLNESVHDTRESRIKKSSFGCLVGSFFTKNDFYIFKEFLNTNRFVNIKTLNLSGCHIQDTEVEIFES